MKLSEVDGYRAYGLHDNELEEKRAKQWETPAA